VIHGKLKISPTTGFAEAAGMGGNLKQRLLLLPGLLCDEALWAKQREGLGGHCDSIVADLSRFDSIEAMADAALAMVDGTFSLAGLSMGGYVAMEIMRKVPQRIRRLALLDTSARADTPEQTQRRLDAISLSEQGKFNEVVEKLLTVFIHPQRLTDAALTERVRSMTFRAGKEAFRRQQKAIMGRIDSRESLPHIICPTLVLCGRQDSLTPPALHEEIAGLIPFSRLSIIDDCGHLSTMERPDAVLAAMETWLLCRE
jgi:pimeloyl-ACP methyl ester carboxylesterase